MDNQEARGILANLEADYRNLNPLVLTNDSIQLVNERIEALGAAISALQAQDLQPTCNNLATDTIYRQAAIDAIKTSRFLVDAMEKVINLPSAQPEIIRCKDCKHWREGTAFSYCDKLHGMDVLDALDYMTAEDDYCSMAERRTDELGDS